MTAFFFIYSVILLYPDSPRLFLSFVRIFSLKNPPHLSPDVQRRSTQVRNGNKSLLLYNKSRNLCTCVNYFFVCFYCLLVRKFLDLILSCIREEFYKFGIILHTGNTPTRQFLPSAFETDFP